MPIRYEHFLEKMDNPHRARHYRTVTNVLHLLRLIRP